MFAAAGVRCKGSSRVDLPVWNISVKSWGDDGVCGARKGAMWAVLIYPITHPHVTMEHSPLA